MSWRASGEAGRKAKVLGSSSPIPSGISHRWLEPSDLLAFAPRRRQRRHFLKFRNSSGGAEASPVPVHNWRMVRAGRLNNNDFSVNQPV